MKRGQVTIFIIVAIVIVVAVVSFFAFVRVPDIISSPKNNPQDFIETCVQESLQEPLKLISEQGGVLDLENFIIYEGQPSEYLCYTEENNTLCVNNKPMLKNEIEGLLEDSIRGPIERCFATLRESFSGYEYIEQPTRFEVKVEPERVAVYLVKEIEVRRGNSVQKFSSYDIFEGHPMYDFITVSTKIVNEEVSCDCNSEVCSVNVVDIFRDYSNYDIELFVSGKNEKVYSIEEIISGSKFQFGVRNCIRLP